MKRKLFYIYVFLMSVEPALADEVNVTATKVQNLDFGTAVMLATSGTVGIKAFDGEPIWLRCMKSDSGNIPTVGQIEFTSPMTDGFDILVIKPTLDTTELDMSGSGCSLNVRNLVLSANSATLTTSTPTQSFNIGGTLEINGYCLANYTYSGEVSISYSVQESDTTELKSGNINVPVLFAVENRFGVIRDTDMNFGTIVTNGNAGTVVLSTDSTISASEGLLLLGGESEGQISIFGTQNMLITNVSYPSSIQICLNDNPNDGCMTVDGFNHLPIGAFYLDESRNSQGYKMLHIGGTLHINANQPVGVYTGHLNVTIAY